MNRRSFFSTLAASAGVALVARYDAVVPAPAPWSGRIVRLPEPLIGQREICCWCCTHECAGCDTIPSVGRMPIAGSPERAYLHYMASLRPDAQEPLSDAQIVRRLSSGQITVEDVYIRLVSAEEIDAPDSPWSGLRNEAFATHVTLLA